MLQAIADVLPLKYYIDLVYVVYLEGEAIWSDPRAVAVVLAWGARRRDRRREAVRLGAARALGPERDGEYGLSMQNPAPIAFVADDGDVRVNFGIFAGREATSAELDELAQTLLERAKSVTVVAENRVVADRETEASVHQIRIEPGSPIEILPVAEQWAAACVADRHADI